MRFLFLFLLCARVFAALPDEANLPPQDRWRTLETAHFSVNYPARLEAEARECAAIAERAHEKMKNFWRYDPARHTPVFIADNEDSANGLTSAIGRSGIVLYLASPDPYSSIGEHSHWLENLIVHEYTHYMTLDRAEGFFKFLQYVFGYTIQPNHIWPDWVAEGLAVYAETRFTDRGRGDGTTWRTMTRSAVANGSFPIDFDHMSSGPYPEFPSGEVPYYLGYSMLDAMEKKFGSDSIAKFVEESSYRLNWWLNGSLENAVGDGWRWSTLLNRWFQTAQESMQAETDRLKSNGSPRPNLYGPNHSRVLGATPSPDGKSLAWYSITANSLPSIELLNVESGETTHIDNAVSGAGLSFSPDGKKLYYSKTTTDGPYKHVSEIFSADLSSGSVHRLTYGANGKDPSLCGDQIVYSSQTTRVSEIRAAKLEDGRLGEPRALYRAPDWHYASVPRCSSDGRTVYFMVHDFSRFEKIMAVDISAGSSARTIAGGDGVRALFPEPSRDGNIYYTRDSEGFYDLARVDPRTGKSEIVARSAYGGYLLPREGGGKLAVTWLDIDGEHAALIDSSALKNGGASMSTKQPAQAVRSLTSTPSQEGEARSYFFGKSLAPRAWSPYLLLAAPLNQYGAQVAGWDDVDSFEYNITAYWDQLTRHAEGNSSFQIRAGTFRLFPTAGNEISSINTDAKGKTEYTLERRVSLDIARPIPGIFTLLIPSVGAEWARTTFDGDILRDVLPPEMRFNADLVYLGRNSYAKSISPEGGVNVAARTKRYYTSGAKQQKALLELNPGIEIGSLHGYQIPAPRSVFDLHLYGAWSSGLDPLIPEADVHVGGHGTPSELDPPLRGYSLGKFRTHRAAVAQAEFRTPIAQLFHGWDTIPLFLQNMAVYAFYDGAKFIPSKGPSQGSISPPVWSLGAGFDVNLVLGYHAPARLRIEYAHGMLLSYGGEESIAVGIGL